MVATHVQVQFLFYDFESDEWDTSTSYFEIEGLLNTVKIFTKREKEVSYQDLFDANFFPLSPRISHVKYIKFQQVLFLLGLCVWGGGGYPSKE